MTAKSIKRERASYTVPSKHPEKKQSIRAIKKYKRLIDLVIKVIAQDTSDIAKDGYPRSRIKINWGQSGEPSWCPKSNTVDKDGIKSYNACMVLLGLYEMGFTEYYPSLIFRERQAFLYQINSLEKQLDVDKILDIEIEREYNVG